MAWQCIAEGATGLIFYSWFDVKRNPDIPFNEQWAGLKRLAAEIDRMTPMLLSTDPVPKLGMKVNSSQPPTWLHWFARSYHGSIYLIAVNDGDGVGQVTFQLPESIVRVRELSTNAVIPHNTREFTDNFNRLDVRIYQIERR
jgi:hypothetical protein